MCVQVTQQQAVDQLQVVQDQLAAQKTETKKLSEQIAAVIEKLDALQRSVADIPAPSVAAPVPLQKSPPLEEIVRFRRTFKGPRMLSSVRLGQPRTRSFGYERYSSSPSKTLRAAVGRSICPAGYIDRAQKHRLETARPQLAAHRKSQGKPAGLSQRART
jgi:uncharacterized coiled-coil protein SlyX